MIKLLLNPSQIITVDTKGTNLKRGKQLKEIKVVTDHSVLIEDDIIKDIIPNSSVKNLSAVSMIDIKDKVVLPGLVECHTHTLFAGSRANEFRKTLNGITYEEIAREGGGINRTVKAVHSSTFEELIEIVKPRIDYFISQGITALEIKTGYGLDVENEIKMLNVINYLNEIYPIDIIPTFLGAHTYPNEQKNDHRSYVNLLLDKMLPLIAEKKLAKFCDGFCEAAAFSAEEIDLIFAKAQKLGFKLRLHTEQFNNIGGLYTALKFNAVSVDHLEVVQDIDIKKISETDTVAVLLPGVSFFLNYQYAPARKLISENAIVALSTDYNPGSSHIANLSFIMFLAAQKMKMTIEETISAVTINAAIALDLNSSIGSIELGKKADFAVFNTDDYSDIIYNITKNINCLTIKNGLVIYNSLNNQKILA